MTAERSDEMARLRQQLADAQLENERLKRRLDEEVGTLNHLIRISTNLNSTLNLPELLRLIMNAAKELFRAEACSVMLVDEETGELVFEVAVGERSEDVVKHRIPPGQGIAGRVAQTGEPRIINSVKDDPDFYGKIDQAVGYTTRNMLAVPLRTKDRVIGVVEIINTQGRDKFEEKDLALAQALTNQAAVAIENARLYQKLSEALVQSRMSYRL
ncbi:MAG TPA: GAF domain-containing protein [Gemmataceae bacterium]|jgi:sigma-B regulation protein RsbU (phosphoserine phosphatase)|nr:GAF domain-containing protein [Gemmataceae bacterium]